MERHKLPIVKIGRGGCVSTSLEEGFGSACGIVETVPSRKADQAGFVDPKLPPPFPPSKGVARVGYLSGTPSQGRVAPIITPF